MSNTNKCIQIIIHMIFRVIVTIRLDDLLNVNSADFETQLLTFDSVPNISCVDEKGQVR